MRYPIEHERISVGAENGDAGHQEDDEVVVDIEMIEEKDEEFATVIQVGSYKKVLLCASLLLNRQTDGHGRGTHGRTK